MNRGIGSSYEQSNELGQVEGKRQGTYSELEPCWSFLRSAITASFTTPALKTISAWTVKGLLASAMCYTSR
jgi:hypothetical protein